MNTTRRDFFRKTGLLASSMAVFPSVIATGRSVAAEDTRLFVAANAFTCNNIYRRDGKNYQEHLQELKQSGVDGVECLVSTAEAAAAVWESFQSVGLQMRSVYTTVNLCDNETTTEAEHRRMVELAKKITTFGTQVVVVNCATKVADGKNQKTDVELIRQSVELEKLGKKLVDSGLRLAVHYHTPEWEHGGREMLHMMGTTDPALVGFCFDTHWSYRACGNSMAAVLAHMNLFADRTLVLHLRQSAEGVWTETFGEGDIDHHQVATFLKRRHTSRAGSSTLPLLVLEQAAEKGTPKTMTPAEVFAKSTTYVRELFGSST